MKTLITAALTGTCLAVSAQAALPPYNDSAWMIQTILDSQEVRQAVGVAFVQGLELVTDAPGGGLNWKLHTRDCTVTVTLTALPPKDRNGVPMPGRTDYKVSAVSPCTNE